MTVAQCSVPGQQKCAIPECPRPSYMEKNGKVHKCCGRTHARELEKRQCMYIQFQTTFIAVYVISIPLPQLNKSHRLNRELLLLQLLDSYLDSYMDRNLGRHLYQGRYHGRHLCLDRHHQGKHHLDLRLCLLYLQD